MTHFSLLHGSSDLYGASRVLLGDATALVQAGHTVSVCLPVDGPLRGALEANGVAVSVEPLRVLRKVGLPYSLRPAFALPPSARKADVVVLWTLAMAPYVPLLAGSRRPAFVAVHELFSHQRLGGALARLVSQARLPVLANSQATAAWLRTLGVEDALLEVAYPAAPPFCARERQPARPLTIMLAGRMNGFKGQLETLAAVERLREDGHRIDVVLAGGPFPGQEQHADAILDFAERSEWVKYVGEVADIRPLLPQVDVLVIATRVPESFGGVALEAWAAGIRCLAPFEGGAAEAAALTEGLTYQPRDDASFREGLLRFVRDPQLTYASSAAPAAALCEQRSRLAVWERLASRALAGYRRRNSIHRPARP